MPLAMRIWRYLEDGVRAHQRQRKLWNDVVLFRELPEILQVDLHQEVYQPTMLTHPFFHQYNEHNNAAMRAICHKAVVEVSLVPDQALFDCGQVAERMFFTVEGLMKYSLPGVGERSPQTITEGGWISEASLWVRWFYMGKVVGQRFSSLIALQAPEFHRNLETYVDLLPNCGRYAKQFAEAIMHVDDEDLSDIWGDFDDLQFLAQRSFEPEEGEEVAGTSSQRAQLRNSKGSVMSVTSFSTLSGYLRVGLSRSGLAGLL